MHCTTVKDIVRLFLAVQMTQFMSLKFTIFIGMLSGVLLGACSARPAGAFLADAVPPAPDYADQDAWASLPSIIDSADVVPDTSMRNGQANAPVDVFFIYPTTYTGKRGERNWNADIYDTRLNVRTDRSAIRNQATVFNGSCKVYAPRYRQAHLESFFTKRHKDDARQALGLAYHDVKAAFLYYLDHYNHGRPLIIAAHSQGTWHAEQLIRDFYDTGERNMPDLIVAYLVGMPVKKNDFETIHPCKSEDDIHCFCSWRTVNEKYKPNRLYPVGDKFAVINPVDWKTDTTEVSRQWHLGAVLTKFYHGIYPELVDSYIDHGLLRVTRPKIPGIPVLLMRNYHIADYNLFYADIRKNVGIRIATYLEHQGVPANGGGGPGMLWEF